MLRECGVRLGQSGATAFPPPLWGRDRERGTTSTAPVSYLRSNKCRQRVRVCAANNPAQCLVATPLPVPPPQGGREPCGAHLRNSNAPCPRNAPEMCACPSASAGTNGGKRRFKPSSLT